MSWAARRRLSILIILGAIAVFALAVIGIATFYHAPTCSDGIQNQGEQGIDCGGPCPNLCTALEEPPTVLFTQAISNGAGRTDVIAEIENKNPDAAAKAVPYTLTLYDTNHLLIQNVSGRVDLPPSATVPVFVRGISSGRQTVASAFLTIDPSAVSWYRMTSDPRVIPTVSNIVQTGSAQAPAVAATLANPSVLPLSQVYAVILVHDASGNVIAASQTVVPMIPGQGSATASFSWNGPFSTAPASFEVVPVVALP